MSVFQVQLMRNVGTGYATDPVLGSRTRAAYYADAEVQAGTEKGQKTIDVTGPNLTRRRLYDGQTFTSTNYWKRFAPTSQGGSMTEENAFISILTDDGTPWDDRNRGLNRFARVDGLTVACGTGFTDAANQVDFLTLYGAVATYTQITTDQPLTVRLNSSSEAEMDLAVGTQIFNNEDLPLTSLAFAPVASGCAGDATVEVITTLQIVSND